MVGMGHRHNSVELFDEYIIGMAKLYMCRKVRNLTTKKIVILLTSLFVSFFHSPDWIKENDGCSTPHSSLLLNVIFQNVF